MDLPKSKCEVCGYWFVTAEDAPVCPTCLEDANQAFAEEEKEKE